MRTPPTAGPAIMPNSPRSESSAEAAISSSRETSRGTIESSAGRWKPSSAAMSGVTTKSTQTFGSSRSELTKEDRRREPERELGELEHAPTIYGIRESAADERREEQGDERSQAEKPDRERRPGEMVDLVRDRDVREHRAEERERLPGEEQAVLPVPPQRA